MTVPLTPAGAVARWRAAARHRRALRALARQLHYQERKSAVAARDVPAWIEGMQRHSRRVRERIESFRPIAADARVIEVGSGAHGLIFYFGARDGVGVDPLADFYAAAFPAWQGRARTVTAFGEALPFDDGAFDIVLCDNVVDHAEDPARIVAELVRVLAPGGLLYFTVNVHHRVYHAAATAHNAWRALGVPFEIRPFADHTVHLTPAAARRLFRDKPLTVLSERCDIAAGRLRSGEPVRFAAERVKRFFFKNVPLEIIAVREA